MTPITISLIVSIGLALIGVIGDTLIRMSGAGPKFMDVKLFLLGSFIYCSTIFGWFFVMKYLKFSTIGVFYGVSTLLFLVIIGVFQFKETLSTYEIIGIFFAIASIILLGKHA